MAYPAGVSLAVVTVGHAFTAAGGDSSVKATLTPVFPRVGGGTLSRIVHAATGTVMWPETETFTAPAGSGISFSVPHVDQAGWRDPAQNAYTMWYYAVTVEIGAGTNKTKYVQNVQPLVGQSIVDLDMVPDGQVGDPVAAPTPVVTSVNGQTGIVNLDLSAGAGWNVDASLGSTDSLDTLTAPGLYNTGSSSTTGIPFAGLFTVSVEKVGSAVVQRAIAWNDRSLWIRTITSGTPSTWVQYPSVADVEQMIADGGGSQDLSGYVTDEEFAAARWQKPTMLPSTTHIDSVKTPGLYQVPNANAGLPVPQVGMLEVMPLNLAQVQRYTTWGTSPRMFFRGFSTSGTPYAWVEFAKQASITSLETRVSTLETSPPTAAPSSGMKVVPLTMTAPGTPVSMTTDGGAVRWVRRYAVAPKRVRVHVSNANTGNALTGNETVNLSHIRVGVGDAAGGYTGGVLALTGGELPADGSEVVTPWTDVPALSDGGYVNVTVSWWGGGGDAVLQVNQGGGWTTTDGALASAAGTTGWTRSETTPLHCWIEAEVPTSTPVLCGHGDSITIGTRTTDPVGDSWASVYAYEQGALPVILAMHGSRMDHWDDPAEIRYGQYGDFELRSVVDATVTTLGQNDLADANMTLATLQARHTAMMGALRQVVSGPVYLGAITPSNKAAAVEQLRRDFNAWRATLPEGERGVLDFAHAVDDGSDENLDPALTVDTLHPNTAGQALMADVVLANPVTPFTPAPSQLKALLGG